MVFFSSKKEGGMMDVIRCDEPEYLVWKWRPSGIPNSTRKENSIRYGSRLRVKDGEMAVFFYPQNNGTIQDYIFGPFDQVIETANFPILTTIIGSVYNGETPFQAEIYFINLAGNNQLRFGIPYFDMYDPRYIDLGIPCAVRGNILFNITDYKNFIKLNRLINFDLNDFNIQIRNFLQRVVKSVVLNIPQETNISVMQIESKIDDISEIVYTKMHAEFEEHFGVNLKRLDIGVIELDKEHPNYHQLKQATADQLTKLSEAKTDIEIENMSEMARIQRREAELGAEGRNLAAHQLNQQTSVLKTAAENFANTGNIDLGGGEGGGFNPAGLMLGMGIGGVLGNQIGGMMGNIGNTSNMPPPPPPVTTYYLAINGQQSGPFNLEQLKQFAQSGQFTTNYYVWKQGMAAWELANNVPEVAAIFAAIPPPPPSI
jgi:membrane protease subunit (stomatin/prohibitin family)